MCFLRPMSFHHIVLAMLTLGASARLLAIEFNDQTLALLKSPRPADRQRFYALLPSLSIEDQKLAVGQLNEAREYWKAPVVKQVLQASAGQGTWSSFLKANTEWREAVKPLMTNIRTDYHKDPKKIAELSQEFERCEKLHMRARRAAAPAERGDFARLLAGCAVLYEIEKWIDNPRGAAITFRSTPADILAKAMSDSAEEVSKVKALANMAAAEKRLAEAEAWNASCRWAKPEQIRFASILNQKRHVVDLPPLRLDEKLCKTSTDHSLEMVALKYFAHESPVVENKSFGDRAKNAGFDGFASGENIFAGNRSPDAAYGGWWASDGHRFIMFMDGVNTLGVGNGGTDHWTMNPGSKAWPAPIAPATPGVPGAAAKS